MVEEFDKKKRRIRRLLFALAMVLLISASALTSRRLRAVLRGRTGMQVGSDSRLWVEPGVNSRWEQTIAAALDDAVECVESAHGRKFVNKIEVCLCATQRSYNQRTGDPPDGAARGSVFLNRVILSPRCWQSKSSRGILTHELSHLHLRQVMGSRYTTTVPGWFQEGFAVFVSGGAGAEPVTTRVAIAAIKRGLELKPESDGSSIPRMAAAHGLRHHMFYRQSAMFVEFLATSFPAGLAALLKDIQSGTPFATAFPLHFEASPRVLWDRFADSLRV